MSAHQATPTTAPRRSSIGPVSARENMYTKYKAQYPTTLTGKQRMSMAT
jgi:hypothetical protein